MMQFGPMAMHLSKPFYIERFRTLEDWSHSFIFSQMELISCKRTVQQMHVSLTNLLESISESKCRLFTFFKSLINE